MNEKKSVLVIDDENSNCMRLMSILKPEYDVFIAKNGKTGISAALNKKPHVILLDILMPEMDGYEVINKLKNTEETKGIPVIFLTGLSGYEHEEKGLELGADDYISKPFNSAIVRLRLRKQLMMTEQLEKIKQLSEIDLLTGIANRRIFDNRLNLAWEQARRDRRSVVVFMIDVDDFKHYNDTHGHLQGDVALQTVARSIEQSLKRSLDIAARWGGEEFSVLLSEVNLNGALIVAENIRRNIEAADIPSIKGLKTNVTVSIGINIMSPCINECSTITELIAGADSALYAAKRAGKNKVCVYNGEELAD
jgi:diguanylate cyclase (GGDEF)-like protein